MVVVDAATDVELAAASTEILSENAIANRDHNANLVFDEKMLVLGPQ